LLISNNENQVLKSNNLLDSLLKRITKLETQPATAIPYGIVAIWGKSERIPDGWEEYIPMKGRMPVGQQIFTSEEKSDAIDGDGGNGFSYYRDYYGTPVFPFETLGSDGGRMSKRLSIPEIPAHTHTETRIKDGGGNILNFDAVGDDAHAGYESIASGSTGGGQSFSILNPYKVVQFIIYTGRPRDNTAPTAPVLTISSLGTTSIALNWTGSTDDYGVTEYIVYGNAIGETPVGNVFNKAFYGLTPGATYTFYVVAKDAAGNTSPSSNVVETTISAADLIAPTTPTGLTCYAPENGYLTVGWNPSTDNVGVTNYQVWRRTLGGGASQLYLGTPENSCTVYGTANTTYYFKVMAFDAAGNSSAFSSEVSGTVTSGGGGGGGCFDIESLVTMASGQSKKLKNIEIGDKLQGFSFPNEIDESDGDYMVWNGKLNEGVKVDVTVVNKQASLQPNYFEIKTADATIKATGQHPLLVTEDGENVTWVCVKNVSQNMLLIDKTGKTKAIESIVFKEEPLEVILLDVEDVDNYVISGIVAHNNKPIEQQ
jgi:chitodextrinase